MKKKSSFVFIMSILVLQLYGCSDPTSRGSVNTSGSWLKPSNEVRDGGPGRDGIPALSSPEFLDAMSASYLQDNDLVVGIKVGNEARAYPHKIFDWHEIINQDINGELIAVTYCPLTGSAIGWDRRVGGRFDSAQRDLFVLLTFVIISHSRVLFL